MLRVVAYNTNVWAARLSKRAVTERKVWNWRHQFTVA